MRMIGQLQSKGSATVFSDFLYVNGISNTVEADKDAFAIWIHNEDELDKARVLLADFQRDPSNPRFAQQGKQAQELKQREQLAERAAEKRHFDRDRIFGSGPLVTRAPATFILIVLSILATVGLSYGYDRLRLLFYFSLYQTGAPEIFSGEIWRAITPIFLHASLKAPMGFLHLPFNMLWLYDLGGMIEQRKGSIRFLFLALVIAVISNSAQYIWSGGNFGGMSGVVYGLLGYVWMKGSFDPDSGLFLHPQIVTMMMVWFFLCLFNFIPNVANAAHAGGLVVGLIWGLLSSLRSRAR